MLSLYTIRNDTKSFVVTLNILNNVYHNFNLHNMYT